MEIEILQLTQGARNATGLTVIIDVFRAFSLACYAFHNGCDRIFPVGTVEEALQLKKNNPDYLLFGEVNERRPDGFDFGNSPAHIEHVNLQGKSIIHRTSAGTQGIVNALNAREIITGSFVNAGAITAYIRRQNPAHVSLVCMGYSALEPADEDSFCAELIRARLKNKKINYAKMVEKLRTGSGKRLLDPINAAHSPARDFELCTRLDLFNFVLRVNKGSDRLFLQRINISENDY
jgi:2-phosphosulfolactate phosphatase